MYYETSESLMHYGVPGMKWGHRKYYNSNGSLNKAGKARQAYKDAKKNRKETVKRSQKDLYGFGVKGIAKANKAQSKIDKAYMNEVTAKANYKAAKAKSSKAASKAEFKTYKKAMKSLPGSMNDSSSGGRSTKLYNQIKKEKGKAYADKVINKREKELVTQLVGSVAVTAGTMAVSTYLAVKGY